MLFRNWLIVGVLFLGVLSGARSAVIVDSIDIGTESFGFVNSTVLWTLPFETGAEGGELASVSIEAAHYFSGSSSLMFGRLYATNSSFVPSGSSLLNFTSPSIPQAHAIVSFLPVAEFVLQPNTKYAFVVGSTDSAFYWYGSVGGTPSGSGTIPNHSHNTTNNGATWHLQSGVRLSGRVETVPEPACGVMLVLGSLVIAFRRKIRRA